MTHSKFIPVEIKKLIFGLRSESRSEGKYSKEFATLFSNSNFFIHNFNKNGTVGVAPGRGLKRKMKHPLEKETSKNLCEK